MKFKIMFKRLNITRRIKDWFKKIYFWCLQWSGTKWSVWALFICAFADASFLPLPTPMFFLSLALLNVKKVYKYALSATLGTFFGALGGYSIGHFAWLNMHGEFTGLAQFLFNNVPGFSVSLFISIQALFNQWNFWILFVASLIPLPYKIFSISSGVFDINVFIFSLATLASQGIKFYLLGLLIINIGPEVKKLFEFKLKYVVIITATCIAITVFIIKVF
jgi:membrane protein YqaA with SNARE-associated domain